MSQLASCSPGKHRYTARGLVSATLVVISMRLLTFSVSGQTIVVDTPTIDAGIVTTGTPITREFVLRNTGTAPLRITSVKPACGCMQAKFDRTIAPGSTGKVILTIATHNFQTAITKTAAVSSNDPATPEVTLTVAANVRGFIWAEPSSVRIRTTQGTVARAEVILASADPAFRPTVDATSAPFVRATILPHAEPGKWTLVVTSEPSAPVGLLAERITLKTGVGPQPEYYISVAGVVKKSGDGGASASSSAGAGQPILTNDEVTKLVAADLGDEIVIAKIKNAPVAQLDVDTEALLKLKEKKISTAVVTAMIERAAAPNKAVTTDAPPPASTASAPRPQATPCAGIELMGLYKNEIFDRAMGGGIVEWLTKIRNNTSVTKIVVFGWRDAEGQQRKAQVQIGGGEIASPRVDLTQARLIAPVADLRLLSCE